MFELQKTFTFEAGHSLSRHKGKCHTPHGHSYTLTIILQSEMLRTEGAESCMVMDFYAIKAIVDRMLFTCLDHQWLNDTLETDSPTAEYIARWVYQHLKPQLPLLHAVTIHETATAQVTYRE